MIMLLLNYSLCLTLLLLVPKVIYSQMSDQYYQTSNTLLIVLYGFKKKKKEDICNEVLMTGSEVKVHSDMLLLTLIGKRIKNFP